MAKQDQDKKKKRKLEKRAKRKKGIFENPLAGKPVQDPNLPDFNVEGSFNQKGYNVRGYGFKIESENLNNLEVSYGGGKRTAFINKKTLEKGGATLIGMAPQENRQGQRVQGFNYANLNYVNAVQNNKDLQEAKRYYGVGSVGVDKRTQFANNQKKVDAILKTREIISYLPERLKTDKVITAIKDKSTEQEKRNQTAINSRLKQKSLNKVARAQDNMTRDPYIVYANKIQSELGRSPIKLIVTRRRRGRWSTSLSADPNTIIDDYHKKSALIEYAKEVDPDHAKIDPERMVTVVDTETARRVPTYWTHNNRRRRTGYRTEYDRTYKDVKATSRPKGEQMDLLYGKIIDKSQEKKKKYENYYETDPNVEVYNYYSITDEDFNKLDEYKTSLVTNIRETEDAKYDLQNRIIGTFAVDATTPLDDNAPKQKYIQYQKTGQDNFITPTVTRLQSEISTIDKDVVTQQQIIDAEKQNIDKNLQLLDPTLMVDTLTPIAESKSNAKAKFSRCRPAWLCADNNALSQARAQTTREEGKALFETVEEIKKADLAPTIDNLDEFAKYEWANTQVESIKKSQQKITNLENKIATIREDAGGYRANENQNITNAIAFIEGKTRRFEVDGVKIARRDNFGRIKILDEEAYAKYIKNTPSEYLRQPDQLDKTVIPELEEDNKETTEKYNEVEKEYYRKERMRAQFGTTRPKGKVRGSRGGRRRRR